MGNIFTNEKTLFYPKYIIMENIKWVIGIVAQYMMFQEEWECLHFDCCFGVQIDVQGRIAVVKHSSRLSAAVGSILKVAAAL